jgi:hypothetical protein
LRSDKSTLSPRWWLAEVIGLTLCVAAAVVLINVKLDIYGIFRDARDRHLVVYGDPRVSKYLLSERYVPENFDAVLVGTSVSANWRTGLITPLRVYNESLDGGVIVEGRAIAERALPSGHIKLVLLLIQPYLTADNNFRTVQMTPQQNIVALGSKSLLDAYRDEFSIREHREPKVFDEFGAQDFGNLPQQLNKKLQKMWAPSDQPFNIDPAGMKDYRELVQELHASNIPIVFVIPPIAENLFEGRRGAFDSYSRMILAMKVPRDQVIDFSTDQFRDFRADPDNFRDGVHMTDSGADRVVVRINDQLTAWMQGGQIQVSPAAK